MPVIGPGTGASLSSLDWLRPRMVGWYESWDVSTLTLSGTSLTRWRDKSPRGRDFTASANQPTVDTLRNGLPVVKFTKASSQKMTCTGFNLSIFPFSIFVLCQTGDTTNQYVMSSSTGAGSDPALITRYASLGTEWYVSSGARLTSITSTTAGDWHVSTLITPRGGTMTAYGDGIVGETGTRGVVWDSQTAYFDTIGSSATADYYGGSIAAIVQINDQVTPQEHTRIRNYLCAKVGIASAAESAFGPPLVFQ